MLPLTTYLPRTFIQQLIRDAEVYIDDLQQLGGLILYQEQRITAMIEFEKTFGGMALPATRDEIRLLAELLRQMRDTKIALGVAPEEPYSGPFAPATDVARRPSELEVFLSQHPERIEEMQPLLAALAGVTLDGVGSETKEP
jgi:hypothetical protein